MQQAMNLCLDRIRASGEYPAYDWSLDGAPLYYQTISKMVLCPQCAEENADMCRDKENILMYVTDIRTNIVDENFHCHLCNQKIDSLLYLERIRSLKDKWC